MVICFLNVTPSTEIYTLSLPDALPMYRKEDKRWYIKREGSDKILRVLDTQREAIAYATIKAITQDTGFIIHNQDGKIRKVN